MPALDGASAAAPATASTESAPKDEAKAFFAKAAATLEVTASSSSNSGERDDGVAYKVLKVAVVR